VIIRDIQESDIPVFIDWLNRFNSSFEYPGKRPIDNDCAANFFSRFIDNQSQAALVLEKNNKPVATIGFAIIPHPWNGEKIFFKAFWYSAKPGAGRKLLRYVRDLCEAGGVGQMIVSSMTPSTNRLLELEGFLPCEMNYVLDFKGN